MLGLITPSRPVQSNVSTDARGWSEGGSRVGEQHLAGETGGILYQVQRFGKKGDLTCARLILTYRWDFVSV